MNTEELLSTLSWRKIRSEPEASVQRRFAELRREDVTRPAVFVGAGSCGLGAGAADILELAKRFIGENAVNADLIATGCLGLCSQEPLADFQIPGRMRLCFGRVTPERMTELCRRFLRGGTPSPAGALFQFPGGPNVPPWPGIPLFSEFPFFRGQTRRVLENCGIIDPGSLEEYLARDGYRAFAKALHTMTPSEVCAEVENSRLRGRGGGGFPTGSKWRSALNAPGDRKFVICNADEGDPGAFMCRNIIEGDPHRLIEGIAIAAYSCGASRAYIYIRDEYHFAAGRIAAAVQQAREAGLLGDNILDSGFDLGIVVRRGAGAFVCGEETALIGSLEGERPTPRARPPYPSEHGLFGMPTVIDNVETLANVPLLIRNGSGWFRSIGTPLSGGTKIFALSGKLLNNGLVEVPFGTPLRELLFGLGGGIAGGRKFKAVHVGGPSGGFLPESMLDVPADYETLRDAGAMIGSGGLIALDRDNCIVDAAASMLDFIQNESCGKCTPCREGTRRLASILKSLSRGRLSEKKGDALSRFRGVLEMERLATVMHDASLCGLGRTAANPVLSSLRWFRPEYEEHIFDRRCRAGVCRELIRYRIDSNRCIGCGLCLKICPAGAISGTKRSPHSIIPEKCTGCGECVKVCKFNSVETDTGGLDDV